MHDMFPGLDIDEIFVFLEGFAIGRLADILFPSTATTAPEVDDATLVQSFWSSLGWASFTNVRGIFST